MRLLLPISLLLSAMMLSSALIYTENQNHLRESCSALFKLLDDDNGTLSSTKRYLEIDGENENIFLRAELLAGIKAQECLRRVKVSPNDR